jgi:hypothetical protein
MGRFEWDWFIGWTCATIMVLGILTAIYYGAQNSNEKYYEAMNKCTAAGGTFIPTSRGEVMCLMGNKQ